MKYILLEYLFYGCENWSIERLGIYLGWYSKLLVVIGFNWSMSVGYKSGNYILKSFVYFVIRNGFFFVVNGELFRDMSREVIWL